MIVLISFINLVLAGSAIFHAGWGAGVSLFVASELAMLAGARIRSIIFHENWSEGEPRNQASLGLVISVAIVGASQWFLADNFSAQILGYDFSGSTWIWINLIVGYAFSTPKMFAGVGISKKGKTAPETQIGINSPTLSVEKAASKGLIESATKSLDSDEFTILPEDYLAQMGLYTEQAESVPGPADDKSAEYAAKGADLKIDIGNVIALLKETKRTTGALYYAKFGEDPDDLIGDVHHGWYFDQFALVNGIEVCIGDALVFEHSIPGMISAMFVAFVLPTIGAFWHGLYYRDYTLITSAQELNDLLFSDGGFEFDPASPIGKKILRIPIGLRVQKTGNDLLCTHLCYSETEGLEDHSFVLNQAGRITLRRQQCLLETKSKVLY